jgi:very-short-patch-repair endonuclease
MAKRKKSKIKSAYKKLKFQAKNPYSELSKKKNLENKAKKMSKKMTLPEKIFSDLMKEMKIKCEPQKIVGGKIYDFYLPKKNILIEIDGDYYHANPEIFQEQNNMQKRNVKNDAYKDTLALGMGYNLERVWENDLKKNLGEVKKRFKKLLK